MNEEIYCAISGISAPETPSEIPEGWVKLTIERQYVNPKWMAIQVVKQGLMQQTLEQLPAEDREQHMMMVQIQVEAQYALLEDRTEPFFSHVEEIYISNPDENEGVAHVWSEVAEALGLDEMEEDFEEEESEEGEEEEEEEEKDEPASVT